MDHGGSTCWGNPWFFYNDIDSSIYNNVLPFVLSGACLTGAFHNHDDCMAERFLCADSIRGAIGFIGASVETTANSFYIIDAYFHSLLNNFSSITGESIMEVKVRYGWNATIINHNNLFGDPALNILYENTGSFNCDLLMQEGYLSHQPNTIFYGDTLKISAVFRNLLCSTLTASFNVSCYLKETTSTDSLLVGTYVFNGMENCFDTAVFVFNTLDLPNETLSYKLSVYVDADNNITELDEANNSMSSDIRVFKGYNPAFHISNLTDLNSHPVSYDIYPDTEGEEIVFGSKTISSNGLILDDKMKSTLGYTSIANLYNDDEFQIVQFTRNDETYKISLETSGDNSWEFPLPSNCLSVNGPIVYDLDNNGTEEIVFIEQLFDSGIFKPQIKCVNSNGEMRWEADLPVPSYIRSPLIYNSGEQNSIVLCGDNGKVYFMVEAEDQSSLIVSDSIVFSVQQNIVFNGDPISSDISKDGNADLVFIYSHPSTGKVLVLFDLTEKTFITHDLGNGNIPVSPIMSDLNNDGIEEISVLIPSIGIVVFNHLLSPTDTLAINGSYPVKILSGDFNSDMQNDLACAVDDDLEGIVLKFYSLDGTNYYSMPLVELNVNSWISDIDNNGKIDYVYSKGENLYVVSLDNAGSSIGWPGQQGNVRNTGVLEQPAYFAPANDTVYWANTISLSPDVENIIPEKSTVIIKPGTKIKAHSWASLIVQGTLIATATEEHPVVFGADINGSAKGYWQGITVSNSGNLSIEHCEVKDAEIGLLAEDNSKVSIIKCTVENNLVGIGAFNSEPYIKQNFITYNDVGISSYKNSSPVLSDMNNEIAFRNGIINNPIGININNANIFLDNGGNDIYNSPQSGYYLKLSTDYSFYYINATYNYWGSSDIKTIQQSLYPAGSIRIDPIYVLPQSPYAPSGNDKTLMLKNANIAKENGDFQTAENTYKAIILQFPASQEAYISVSGIFECVQISEGDMQNLEAYYTALYNDSTLSSEFHKLVFGYMNLCMRAQEKFAEAIVNYESIIINNPTYNDSVYAVIDIGNTYEEAGNYKSTLGQMSYLVPVSRGRHIEKTVDLLLSLHIEDNQSFLENSNLITINAYPNPVKGNLIIEYELSAGANIGFSIHDLLGKEVMRKNEGFKSSGQYVLEYDMSKLKPGVYYLSVSLEGNQAYSTKIVKR